MSVPPGLAMEVWDQYVDGGSIPEDHPFFEKVDGLRDVSALVSPCNVEGENVARLRLRAEMTQFVREKVWETVFRAVVTDRPVSGPAFSYEGAFNVGSGRFFDLIRVYCDIFGIDKASLADFGCGDGVAFKELCGHERINEDASCGITLPYAVTEGGHEIVTGFSDPMILVGNVLHVKPRVSFDIVLSSWGVFMYHPYGEAFAILQLINAAKVNGLLMVGPASQYGDSVDRLIKCGVLSVPDGLRCFAGENNRGHDHPLAYILKRRPTIEEMQGLIGGERYPILEIVSN